MENSGRTVLVVEDDEDTRTVIKKMLHYALGCTTVEAEDGRDAVELARRQCPDLILMDLQLPGMSGLEAMALIRSQPETATIPVIVISNYCWDPAVAAQARTAGAIECVDKSQLVDLLISAVRPHLLQA